MIDLSLLTPAPQSGIDLSLLTPATSEGDKGVSTRITKNNRARLQEAKNEKRAKQGRYIAHLLETHTPISDAIMEAAADPDLAAIPLKRLLMAYGYTKSRTDRICGEVALRSGGKNKRTPPKPKISWLADKKTNGARISALAGLLAEPTDVPWAGFPATPPPPDIQKAMNEGCALWEAKP